VSGGCGRRAEDTPIRSLFERLRWRREGEAPTLPAAVSSETAADAALHAKVESAVGDLHRDGIARVRGVFDLREMDFLRADAYMALTRVKSIRERGYPHSPLEVRRIAEHEFPALLFWPCLASAYLEALRTDLRLRAIVTRILGPDVKQLNNQVYYRLPGDADSFSWHQDIVFRKPLDEHPGIEEGYLQTIIVVDRMTAENGAIWFVPGSHRLGDLELIEDDQSTLRDFDPSRHAERFGGLEPEVYEAEPGDVLVWSLMTVHGSAPTAARFPRMTYMNGFCRADAAKQWPHYLRGGRPVPLDPRRIP
jgi:ectoine hydroxylase-related dioxygenase (phytanoyl-CoA dioxygenase family)